MGAGHKQEGERSEGVESKEVRCARCNKMLGTTGADYEICAQINAASYDGGEITFNVKCPRCGQVEQITFKR
jgi:phage FluMu protein Com